MGAGVLCRFLEVWGQEQGPVLTPGDVVVAVLAGAGCMSRQSSSHIHVPVSPGPPQHCPPAKGNASSRGFWLTDCPNLLSIAVISTLTKSSLGERGPS